MAIRMMEMKRILKGTGAFTCIATQQQEHYLKLMMDAVFSRKHFQSTLHGNEHLLTMTTCSALFQTIFFGMQKVVAQSAIQTP